MTFSLALLANCQRVFIGVWVICIILNASCATGITKKQRQTLSQHADVIAEAINATVTYVKQPLLEFYLQNGYWPANDLEQHTFVQQLSEQLRRFHIASLQLAAVDREEIIVEFFLSHINGPKLPQLIESWLIVFQVNHLSNLQILSIYPVWRQPEVLAEDSSFNPPQIGQLQQELKRSLDKSLNRYSIKLNENFSRLSG